MDNRAEFVRLACQAGANVSALCRRFGISRKTGYKWLGRARSGEAPSDRSHRHHTSPSRTPAGLEAAVLDLRAAHPSWGGRKLRRRLQDQGPGQGQGQGQGPAAVPAASTITAVLARHGQLGQPDAPSRAFTRFAHAQPNALWQMDFKGHFACTRGRCHPLTVLDDHSRSALCLPACTGTTTATVQQGGWVNFRGRAWRIPKAFVGPHVALRPTERDGRYDIVFIAHTLGQIDLSQATGILQPVTHLSEQVSPLSPV